MRVLVTGGATGIGRAVAARLGSDAIITGRRAELLRQAATATGARAVPGDVTVDPDGLLDAVGEVQGLVHCAGHLEGGPLEAWTGQAFERLFRVHVTGPALLSRAFAQRSTDPGSIVFCGSTLAVRSAPARGPYAAAKAAQLSLARSLAVELADRRIRVNAVLVGVVPTEMTAGHDLEALAALHPLGLGTADAVAQAILGLLDGPWITGAALPVDGGLLAR